MGKNPNLRVERCFPEPNHWLGHAWEQQLPTSLLQLWGDFGVKVYFTAETVVAVMDTCVTHSYCFLFWMQTVLCRTRSSSDSHNNKSGTYQQEARSRGAVKHV